MIEDGGDNWERLLPLDHARTGSKCPPDRGVEGGNYVITIRKIRVEM
jgi:hypothetical protein